MKTNSLPALLALTAVLAGNALALTPIVEAFNGTTLDKTRWFAYQRGTGKFKLADQTLNFLNAKATTLDDFAAAELLTSQPGYNESWELIVDLSNTIPSNNLKAACGFLLANQMDRKDYLYFQFFGKGGISVGVILNGQQSNTRAVFSPVGLETGSLRVSFNKNTKLMTFEGSLTAPGKPYKWTRIGTFSPAGLDITGNAKAKKQHIKADWQMNPGSGRFAVQVFGFSQNVRVTAGKATIDNFKLSAL